MRMLSILAGSSDSADPDGSKPQPLICSSRRAHGRSVWHVGEPAEVALEGHLDSRGRSVAVLGDDDVRFTGSGRLALVHVLAVHQQHQVGILLDGTGFSKIREQRLLVGALFRAPVELR